MDEGLRVDLHVDDAGFVRAPVDLTYRRLTHVAAWPTWWSGTTVRTMPPRAGDECWGVEWRVAPLRRRRVAVRLHGWRHAAGFLLELDGDVTGRAEFWLEASHGGTVVHHLLAGRSAVPDGVRLLADYRRAIRRGLWGLKDALHLEARTSAGLRP